MTQKKTALVTGATGQDGAYLAELLLSKGYQVHGVKRRSSSFNTGRVEHLYQDPHESNKNYILHYGDVTDSLNLIRLVQSIQPDEIYNLAAQSHVAVSFETPEYTGNADGLGALRLLEAIRTLGLEGKTRFYQASTSDQSSWRRKIETEVEIFKDISQLSAGDAAQLIYNDAIHILVNLNGYTKGAKNEIFALHPSPIQITLMGYCGTMGADFMEYIVADKTTIPVEYRSYYQEKVINMPHSYFVNDHRQSSREVLSSSSDSTSDDLLLPTRAQYGLPEDKFVFCNFNQLYKIDPDIFDIWMKLLKRIPNSVLWLLRFPPAGEENILQEVYYCTAACSMIDNFISGSFHAITDPFSLF